MKCPKCHSDNTSDSSFCSKCGTQLLRAEEALVSYTKTIETPLKVLTKGSIFAGKYKIIEELGRGGMGVVFKAEDIKLKRPVALKFLPAELARHPEARERFIHEAQAASALEHPNICTVHEINESEDGQLFIAMTYYEGQALKEKIKQGSLDLEEVMEITLQIAQGLAKAHRKGIVHRDIKPGNILVTDDGVVKIVDFGLAKLAGTTQITKSGTTLGTAAYMSPEQASGESVDDRTDLWSLGVVLYEMLAGHLPFRGEKEQGVVYAILNKEPEALSGSNAKIPVELEKIVAKTLTKDLKKRYQRADELLGDLQKVYKILDMKPAWRIPHKSQLLIKRWLSSPLLWASLLAFAAIIVSLTIFFPSKAVPFQERDWILIMDFENLTGDEVFSRSLDTGITVSLQQSSYANVFPRSRVKEILQRMGKAGVDKLDEKLGEEVALRAGIKALVACSISNIGDVYSLSARIVDPNSQLPLKTETIQARGKEKILEALDNLARKIRRDLGESLKDIKRQNVRLPEATTSSLEALKKYSEGSWFWGEGKYNEAYSLWQAAIKLDPDFAWAHTSLGGWYYLHNEPPKGEEHFQKALSLLDRLTEREKLWLQSSMEAWRGNRVDAIEHLRIFLSRYPDDREAWYNLGTQYMRLDRCEESLQAFNRDLKLDKFDARAYINLATCYSKMKKHQQAIDHYLKAFEIRPGLMTSGNLNHEFGFTYAALGQFQKAKETFEKMLSGDDGQKARGYRSLGLLDMYQGRFSAAINHLKEAALINKTLKSYLSELRDRLYLVVAYKEKDMGAAFLKELNEAISLRAKGYIEPWWLQIAGKIFAREGKIKEANELLEEVSEKIKKDNRDDQATFLILKGEIDLASKKPEEAIEQLELAYRFRGDGYVLESLSHAYFVRGDVDKAILNYERLVDRDELGWEAQEYWIDAHYQLGKLYEQKGNIEKAIQFYQKFLDINRNADLGLPKVEDARKRLAGLRRN